MHDPDIGIAHLYPESLPSLLPLVAWGCSISVTFQLLSDLAVQLSTETVIW
jgi:hypothetical protein